MERDFDVIVVGARCAGSPTAMLLARRGYRVLLVDRSTFPSDTLSTLLIHARGVAALRRWGLLEAVVATGCPPINTYAFDFGPIVIRGTQPPVGGASTAYAPRRTLLDKILVDAAAAAGAEVSEGFTVDEVIFEDGAAAGIHGRTATGTSLSVRAPVVVGADGRYSRVARAVRPEQYNEKPILQWGYYTYWQGLATTGMETTIRPDRGWALIPTNDDLTLLVLGWPYAEATAFKADVEANYLKTLELSPEVAERVRSATRVERFAGGGVENHFRKPYGPGWVLVGDAGYSKDPITAQGISDAFDDADRCATALDQVLSGARSFDDAMATFHQARDAHALPVYEFTTQLATLEPPPPEMQQLLGAVAASQQSMDSFVGLVAGSVSPVDFFDPEHVGRIFEAAAPAQA